MITHKFYMSKDSQNKPTGEVKINRFEYGHLTAYRINLQSSDAKRVLVFARDLIDFALDHIAGGDNP